MRRKLQSGFIAAVLGLQLFAIVNPFARVLNEKPEYLWPFTDYPMYSAPHFPGESVKRYRLYGTLENGAETAIEPQDLGLNFWKFYWGVVPAVLRQNRERLAVYGREYRQRHGARLTSLWLENHPVEITAAGVRPGAPQVLKTVLLASAEEPR